jgi:hypothetical protein
MGMKNNAFLLISFLVFVIVAGFVGWQYKLHLDTVSYFGNEVQANGYWLNPARPELVAVDKVETVHGMLINYGLIQEGDHYKANIEDMVYGHHLELELPATYAKGKAFLTTAEGGKIIAKTAYTKDGEFLKDWASNRIVLFDIVETIKPLAGQKYLSNILNSDLIPEFKSNAD